MIKEVMGFTNKETLSQRDGVSRGEFLLNVIPLPGLKGRFTIEFLFTFILFAQPIIFYP